MALNSSRRIVVSIVLFVFLSIFHASGSECCSSYTDIAGRVYPPQWCSEYCCYDPKTPGFTLFCCNSGILRAAPQYRSSFFIAWGFAHVYVPILVGLAIVCVPILVCIATLCVFYTCCCCCCCGYCS